LKCELTVESYGAVFGGRMIKQEELYHGYAVA